MALVTLRSYRDLVDAELARAKLESEGIRSFAFDQHIVGVQWLYSFAIGGVKVKVDEADLAASQLSLRASDRYEEASSSATSATCLGCQVNAEICGENAPQNK